MKSRLIKGAACLLALLMTFLWGCGGSGPSEGPGQEGILPLPGEEPVDLGGYEFTVADYMDGRWNKDRSGTPYADAWIQLMDEVETLYNCKITPIYLNAGEMFNVIQPEIAAGGKYADIVIATEWQYGYFLGASVMMDLNKLEVNWDNEWWNQKLRATTSYGGRSYVAGGSFIFDTMWTWLLYYNDAIWKECGFEDPYKLVDEHRWTQDLFADYCRRAAKDMDMSGDLDSFEDQWGIVAADWDFCDAWFQGMGGHIFRTNPETGRVRLACSDQHTYDVVEKMYKMIKQDRTFCTLSYEDESQRIAQFVGGGSLFYAYRPGVGGLQNMEDDWGVIPLPLFDGSQQEYLSGVDHNASVFGVTSNNGDIREVSIILEALGRHGMILENIYWPDYKETYWRHEESDTRMVSQYVVGHGQTDLAQIMANVNAAFSRPRSKIFGTVFRNDGPDFASYIEAVEDMVNVTIDEYFQS